MKNITLYKITSNGQVQEWEVSHDNHHVKLRYGLKEGAKQIKKEFIDKGKGGRTLEEQISHRIKSRVNKQLDKGYRYNLENAFNHRNENSLNLLKPMLAINLHKVKDIDWAHIYAQYKYDGHRCLMKNDNGKIIAYTRQGKLLNTLSHIIKNLQLPEGITIDGEIYCHGQSLQTIASWTKRYQDNTHKLEYYAYDIAMDKPYEKRLEILRSIEGIHVAKTKRIKGEDLESIFINAKNKGYEGIILRQNDYSYASGKRSKSLIKVKQLPGYELIEKEYEIVNIIPSKDDWGILTCKLDNDKTFNTPAPGKMKNKTEILMNKEKYIGKKVTVEFPQYTNDNVPFHAVALRVRVDI